MLAWCVAILQAQDIMPRVAAGSGLGNKAKAGATSPPIYGLRRSMTLGEEDRKPVKLEPGSGAGFGFVHAEVIELSSDEEDRPVVKREVGSRTAMQHDPGDVIDLTL
ncbi:hypothetical protein BD310DRAFT_925143, partial [Dichomitus squalens]